MDARGAGVCEPVSRSFAARRCSLGTYTSADSFTCASTSCSGAADYYSGGNGNCLYFCAVAGNFYTATGFCRQFARDSHRHANADALSDANDYTDAVARQRATFRVTDCAAKF
ncbi:MAG: hypothetical protein Fur0021_14750 [Candidatus Promineifilaceae bacterium]